MNADLKRLLEEDPIGTLWESVQEFHQNHHPSKKHPRISKKIQNLPRESRAVFIDASERSAKEAAEFLGVSARSMQAYLDYVKWFVVSLNEHVRLTDLKRSWKMLLHHVPVTVVESPEEIVEDDRPYIILYSADWCFPCQLVRPTFARLARFFDRARLFYCRDDEFRWVQGFVPQLVAHFPDGSRVSAHCGGTTTELWENLNLLITLGRNFRGEGTLVCDEQGCRIES